MSDSKYRSVPTKTAGMPGGIPYIVGNEAAERFSFYGMSTLLAIFMTKHLVDSSGTPDVMSDSEAIEWIHNFKWAAYSFPLLGALLSDIFFGKYKTILSLSIVYCLGHLVLALDETRVGLAIGLSLIAVGAGGIKPCVSAHVGDQFGKSNQHLLPRVFSWFYFAINLGSFISTILTPILMEHISPQIAFGVPGGLMLLATWVFWLGRRKFVHVPPHGREFIRAVTSPQGMRVLLRLSLIFVFFAPFWMLFDQQSSAMILQARSMDLNFLGVEWLPNQIGFVNPVLILIFIPLFSYYIYPAMGRFFEPTPLRKISIGFFVMVISFALLTWVETQISGGRVLQSDSQAKGWSAENLLDGKADGPGWASSRSVDEMKRAAQTRKKEAEESNKAEEDRALEQFIFRLREYREWTISSVAIHPFTKAQSGEDKLKDDEKFDHEACWIKDIRVDVGPSPKGPWEYAGKFVVKKQAKPQSFEFPPTKAKYVRLGMNSNWGGKRFEFGEFEVLAVEKKPPEDAAPEANNVWPNVVATGYRPSIIWQILVYVILTAAEVLASITGLEFAYTHAPKVMKSAVMSLFLVAVALGNFLTARVNSAIQNVDGTSRLPGASYYWFFTAIMLVTALLFVVVAMRYRGTVHIQDESE